MMMIVASHTEVFFLGSRLLLQRPKNGLVVATIELLSSSDKEEDKRLLDNWPLLLQQVSFHEAGRNGRGNN